MTARCLWVTTVVLNVLLSTTLHGTETSEAMLDELLQQSSRPFSARSGEATWRKDVDGRSCTSCHTDSVHNKGSHQKTGKVIEAMAPSVNPERLSDRKKVNKWLRRNCKWTFARECTVDEKGDILLWLGSQ